MKGTPLTFTLVWLVVGMMKAFAALTISLDAPVQNATPGNAVVFTGTLTNTDGSAKLFLNDLLVQAPGGVAQQPNVFFANVPGILLPGESYTGPIFSVAVAANASPGDYVCTLDVKGGADIFAADSLATVGFTVTVVLPVVTITATVPDAAEFGPVSGTFTVTRTGGTGIALGVPFTIGGSAVNGTACAPITSPVTIPVGASAAQITVAPIPNNIAEGDRTVVLTLAVAGTFTIGAPSAATVTIHDKPADQWRLANFGDAANTPAASDAGDWEHDGIANLLEYGLSLDPKESDWAALPQALLVDGYLTLSFVPNPNATDVLCVVEGSANLSSWGTGDVELVTLANPIPPTRRTYRYRYPAGTVGAGYLRLRVDLQP
jgi:hypothetical protein